VLYENNIEIYRPAKHTAHCAKKLDFIGFIPFLNISAARVSVTKTLVLEGTLKADERKSEFTGE
jgi:hypothetical protein